MWYLHVRSRHFGMGLLCLDNWLGRESSLQAPRYVVQVLFTCVNKGRAGVNVGDDTEA